MKNKVMMWRRWILLMAMSLYGMCVFSQADTTQVVGLVSYTTSSNVYVRLGSEDGISIGDTLGILRAGRYLPAMEVMKTSSISSVCKTLVSDKIDKGEQVIFLKIKKVERKNETVTLPEIKTIQDESGEIENEVVWDSSTLVSGYEQNIRGKIGVSAHTNLQEGLDDLNSRMRYTFSMNGNHLMNTPLSLDVYAAYRHNAGPNTESRPNRRNALRVYSLAATYNISENTIVSAGRRINRLVSNIGAVDGIQFQQAFGNWKLGAMGGFRPDIRNYGFNSKLPEYGAYITHEKQKDQGYSITTLAFFEQRNAGDIDRRFVSFQHSSMPIRRMSIFGSFEADLYSLVNGVEDLSPRLTNLYVSMRYRFSRKVSVFASFDSRKSTIYYVTYKDIVERLIEAQSRQGVRFRVNLRPVKFLSIGLTGGYRFQADGIGESRNAYVYLTYSRVPLLNASLTVSANYLNTAYLNGYIYGARLNKELIKGKLSTQLHARYLNYQFPSYESKTQVYGISLSWRIFKRLSFITTYEGNFNDLHQYHRVHVNIVQRF